MKNKNIKVIDEHNIDRNANVMFAVDLNGSEYVVYWIERDETSNNVFVSKVLRNLDGTYNMLNIDDADKKKEVSEIVKYLVSSAVTDQNDKLNGLTKTLSNGDVAKFINVSFNKDQNINVPKTYITTVKKEVTKVAEDYYDVIGNEVVEQTVLTPVNSVSTTPVATPEIVETITNEVPQVVSVPVEQPTVQTIPVVETPVVETPVIPTPVVSVPVVEQVQEVKVEAVVSEPVVPVVNTVETVIPAPAVNSVAASVDAAPIVNSTPQVVSAPVEQPTVQTTPVVETSVVETPVIPTPVVSVPVVEQVQEVKVEAVVSEPVVPVVNTVETVIPAPAVNIIASPVEAAPIVNSTPQVVSAPVEQPTVQTTPVVETSVVETPVIPTPVVAVPVVEQQPVTETLVFNAAKETNLNAALGEVANSNNVPVENVNVIREFGEEAPVVQSVEQPTVAPMVQSTSAVEPKVLVRRAGFANSKFFMVVAIAFFMASCVFLGYEVFNYFQITSK